MYFKNGITTTVYWPRSRSHLPPVCSLSLRYVAHNTVVEKCRLNTLCQKIFHPYTTFPHTRQPLYSITPTNTSCNISSWLLFCYYQIHTHTVYNTIIHEQYIRPASAKFESKETLKNVKRENVSHCIYITNTYTHMMIAYLALIMLVLVNWRNSTCLIVYV